ncbi:cuticle protein 16.5-like [Ctenocephalides felis]|uniref:cuticle protein 16.5-like n=1 Tax=Ctenocephalides felis TaxID=7515 RepID=UPI000E6E572D|nr:cuticle protein 16.5-like [Ctenocephalides felis]
MQAVVKVLAVACVFQAVLAVPFKSEVDEPKLDVVQQNLIENENNLAEAVNALEERQDELEDSLRGKKSLYQVPKSYVPKSYSVAAPVQSYQAPAPASYQAPVAYQPAPASYQVASYSAPAASAAYQAPAAAPAAVYQPAPAAQVVSYQAAAPAAAYAAPAAAYAAPAPSYAAPAPAYAAPAPQVTYTTYTAQPPCPTNYLFGCQPSVAPVPCSQAFQPPQVQLTPYVAPQAPAVYKKPAGGYRAADEEREDMIKNMN